jgi:hypothetical protein
LYTQRVVPNISAKDEYLLYRQTLKEKVLNDDEMQGVHLKRVLQAREEWIELLNSKVSAG